MAVAVLTEVDQGTLEQYDQVNERLAADGLADGIICHVVGAKEGGGFRIFDVWQSEDHYRRFREERIAPAVTEVVGPDALPTREEVFEVHDLTVVPQD
jgi:hypothetical protein